MAAKHIAYQLVGPLHKVLGQGEIERRRAFLQRHAAPDVTIEVRPIESGVASIEGAHDAAMNTPAILASLAEAEQAGAGAAIIGCFSDPGMAAAREAANIPVVGPGASAIHLALQLGNRVSVISPNERSILGSTPFAREMGVESRFASNRGMGLSVLDLARNDGTAMGKLEAAARKCLEEDGADVLVLGCMSMAFMGVEAELAERVGAPVVSPVLAGLKTAEALLACGLLHARSSHPKRREKPVH